MASCSDAWNAQASLRDAIVALSLPGLQRPGYRHRAATRPARGDRHRLPSRVCS